MSRDVGLQWLKINTSWKYTIHNKVILSTTLPYKHDEASYLWHYKYTVDLVIIACLDFHEFAILRLFVKSWIAEFSIRWF